MGLLDMLPGGLKNLIANEEGQGKILEGIGSLLNNPQTGGISGFIQNFKDKGLGDVVSSWISTGKNLPIAPDQIKKVLDYTQLHQLAEKLGVSDEEVSKHLAEYLPTVIDKLTPNGSLPASGDLISKGLDMLKGKLSGS